MKKKFKKILISLVLVFGLVFPSLESDAFIPGFDTEFISCIDRGWPDCYLDISRCEAAYGICSVSAQNFCDNICYKYVW